jgi:hypothetical protein
MTLWPPADLSTLGQASGINQFTLAFITSYQTTSCEAAWGGYYPLGQANESQNINTFESEGGHVIISFGGAAGEELAQTCTSVAQLEAQYQAVVDHYKVYDIDFDIEGATLNDQATINLRNQAIALLQHNEAALGHTVTVSYTLPVLPTGLLTNSLYLLQSAKNNGVNVHLVNIMTMDYGDGAAPNPSGAMGSYAVQALNSTETQLKSIYPALTTTQLWGMLGATPMIGQNDISDEVFSLSDAATLTSFAQSVQLGRLSSWSVARDIQCPTGINTVAQNTCSGVLQSPYAFAHTFGAVAGSLPPPPSTTTTTTQVVSNGLNVVFTKGTAWYGGYSGTVTVTNTTSAPISGWSLTMSFASGTTIASMWNATDLSPTIGTYLVTNASYNGALAPGASTSFGFTTTSPFPAASDPIINGSSSPTTTSTTVAPTTTSTTVAPTTTTTIAPATTTTLAPATGLSLTFTKGTAWYGGYSGTFTVHNGTQSPIAGWTASFTLPSGTTVSNSWNAIELGAGPNWSFSNTTYNGKIPAGSSVTFGVTVTSQSKVAPLPTGLTAS